MEDRSEVGGGRVPPLPLVDGGVHVADPLLLVAVHVLSEGVAGLLARLQPGLVQHLLAAVPRHLQRSRPAPVLRPARAVALRLLEVGQAAGVVPARRPLLLPPVVVLGVAPDVDHGVEGAGAAPDPAPGPVHHAVVDVLLGHRVVEPVVLVVTQVVGQRGRHVDLPLEPFGPEYRVSRPRLHQEQSGARVLRQPVGEDTAGRPRTDHDLEWRRERWDDGLTVFTLSYPASSQPLLPSRAEQRWN